MVARAEASQLNFFAILDLFGVAVAPLERHVRVCIGVHQYVEGTVAIKHWQESDRGSDLAENRLDLGLNLSLSLLFWNLATSGRQVLARGVPLCTDLTYSGTEFS